MLGAKSITDPAGWMRAGRGRRLHFLATDEEVQAWLVTRLPERYGPYHLVGADLTRDGRDYVQVPFRCAMDRFVQCMHDSPVDQPRVEFFIWSEVLTPDLELIPGTDVGTVCSYNGLVILQHGLERYGRRMGSSLALVPVVRNVDTGEERYYEGYGEVYEALRRTIRRALVYSSVLTLPDGTTHEDDHHERMTRGAAQAHEHGEMTFLRTPGRLIDRGDADRRRRRRPATDA